MGEDKRDKGFAGLSSLLPNVDAELKLAEKRSVHKEPGEQKQQVRAAPPSSDRTRNSPDVQESTQSGSGPWESTFGSGAVWGIVVLIALVGGLAWLIGVDQSRSSSSTVAEPAGRASAQAVAPSVAPTPQAAPAPNPLATPKPRSAVEGESASPRAARPAPSPPQTSTATPAPRPTQRALPLEERPPVGSGLLLNANQIRYCMFEDARLEVMKRELDRYSGMEVDGFNVVVSDFNSRCSSFRYRQGELDRIRAEVAVNRSTLESQARRRLSRWRGAAPEPGKVAGIRRLVMRA